MQIQMIGSCILLFVCFIRGIMCDCSPYENKIYQVTINFPGYGLFYAAISFLSNNLCSVQVSAAANLQGTTLTDITGYYECPNATYVLVSGTAYYSPDPSTPYLQNNGGIGLINFELFFPTDLTNCTARSIGTYFKTGSNPYNLENPPTFTEPYSSDTCELFQGPKRG